MSAKSRRVIIFLDALQMRLQKTIFTTTQKFWIIAAALKRNNLIAGFFELVDSPKNNLNYILSGFPL